MLARAPSNQWRPRIWRRTFSSLQAVQESHQIVQFVIGECSFELVGFAADDVDQRCSTIIVEKRTQLSDSAERPRIELRVALFVMNSDSVLPRCRVDGRSVTRVTSE